MNKNKNQLQNKIKNKLNKLKLKVKKINFTVLGFYVFTITSLK
jgi:hypothetical protein